MKKIAIFFTFFTAFLSLPNFVFAHEAYVLTHSEFQTGLMTFSTHPLAPLLNQQYFPITLYITIGIIFLYVATLLFATTSFAGYVDRIIRKAYGIGPLVIRLAISASFFYAALANAILGPELPLTAIAGGPFIRYLLFALSLLIFCGFLTEIAALVGLLLFFYVTVTFQSYMITYANYFGELLVLFLFGSRVFSLDRFFFGERTLFAPLQKFRSLEVPLVRILYGIALMYAGFTIKFLHQSLSIAVYNQYHLFNFFHAPAAFIAAGAGVSEILIGFFIVIGFEQRLTTCISLIFITLSILYFREMLWPHFMLYGISFSLIINSADTYTLDKYLVPFVQKILYQKTKKRP